jgi:hypothetical protein
MLNENCVQNNLIYRNFCAAVMLFNKEMFLNIPLFCKKYATKNLEVQLNFYNVDNTIQLNNHLNFQSFSFLSAYPRAASVC